MAPPISAMFKQKLQLLRLETGMDAHETKQSPGFSKEETAGKTNSLHNIVALVSNINIWCSEAE
jgi:hypothetical protein